MVCFEALDVRILRSIPTPVADALVSRHCQRATEVTQGALKEVPGCDGLTWEMARKMLFEVIVFVVYLKTLFFCPRLNANATLAELVEFLGILTFSLFFFIGHALQARKAFGKISSCTRVRLRFLISI